MSWRLVGVGGWVGTVTLGLQAETGPVTAASIREGEQPEPRARQRAETDEVRKPPHLTPCVGEKVVFRERRKCTCGP